MILLFIEVIVSTTIVRNYRTPDASAHFLRGSEGAVQQQSAEISGGSVCTQKDAATESPEVAFSETSVFG